MSPVEPAPSPLPRILSRPEVWGFGFTNFLLWPLVGGAVQTILGPGATALWAVAAVAGTITLIQVQALVRQWPELTGGTAAYVLRLFEGRAEPGRYAALGFFASWISVVPLGAVLSSDMVGRLLDSFGVAHSPILFRLGFLALMFAIAFAGARALSLLQLMLFVPGVVAFALFVALGAAAPAHPDVPAAPGAPGFALPAAALLALYAVYGHDTSAYLTPEARRPLTVVRCLTFVACVTVPLMAGAGWVVERHWTPDLSGATLFEQFVGVATPSWGNRAAGLTTLLIASTAILGSATALALCSRILHQLSAEGRVGRWLSGVEPHSVFRGPLLACLVLSVPQVFFSGEILLGFTLSTWAAAWVVFHLGLWKNRGASYVRWPHLALLLAVVEILVIVLSGPVLGWIPVVGGLLVPPALVAIDRALAWLPAPRSSEPLSERRLSWFNRTAVPVQVAVMVLVVAGAVGAGWTLARRSGTQVEFSSSMLVLTILFAVLIGVAWSAWTSTRALESYQQMRRQLSGILATAMDPVILVDQEGRIRGANEAAEQLFDRPHDSLPGLILTDLVQGVSGTPDTWLNWTEGQVQVADGSPRLITMVARAQPRSPSPRFTVTLHDLTDRLQAERELALSEERLTLALAGAEQFAWDWNIGSDQFVVASGQGVPLGYSPAEAGADRDFWLRLIHSDDRQQVEEALALHIAGETPMFEAQYRILHKTLGYRWLYSRGRVVEQDRLGKAMRVIGVSMDQTERRGLEHQLIHAQKMDALGQLAGGVAHDFNNALQAIMAAVDMMSLHPERPIGDGSSDLDQVRKAAERAAGLTRQLLTFSRQRAGRPEVVTLNEMVTHVAQLVRRLIGPQVRIVTELAPDAGQVRVDPALLEHALINLSVNARDAMNGPGLLTLTTRRLPSSPDGGDPEVAIEVRDTGVGMDQELIARIFEPFFTTKAPGRGTGLGLPMVYGFVKQSSGRIEVESTPGAGTTMRMVLPAIVLAEGAGQGGQAAPMERGSEVVLLVEDEDGIRELCAASLRELGYSVLEAATGEEAVAHLSVPGHRVALVLTDVAMAGMGGLALGRWVADHHPAIALGYMSGYIPGNEKDVAAVDPSRILLKPFRLEVLAAKVRELLSHNGR